MPPNANAQLFSKVAVARELLRQKAEEIISMYMENAKKAQDSGDYETAAKSLQWLLEHMPADMDGVKVVDQSVDKKAIAEGPKNAGPTIQIGIAVGGMRKPSELPAAHVEVIDVEKA